MLAAPESFEILGFVATAGNIGLDHTVVNALKILELANRADIPVFAGCPQPKLFISGDHDEFCPSAVLEQVAANSPGSHECQIIAGADHFFQGIPSNPKPKLGEMQTLIRTWLMQNFHLEPPA